MELSSQKTSAASCHAVAPFPSAATFTPKVHIRLSNPPSICYARVATSQLCKAFAYVGCSQTTLTSREASRNRGFKQVQAPAIVHAELALRWWHKHNNYNQYVPITIQHSSSSLKRQLTSSSSSHASTTRLFTNTSRGPYPTSTNNSNDARKQDTTPFGPSCGEPESQPECRLSPEMTPSNLRKTRGCVAGSHQPFLQHQTADEAHHQRCCHLCPA